METKYYQSCSMPMNSAQLYGSNSDGSQSEDYCSYCFANGKFTMDCTMDEMINSCAIKMASFHKDMTESEARDRLKQFIPTLKR